ncbi:MAG: hypothetical protein ACR2FM_00710 [Candidatus Saccharimonadales bacterium]
MSFEQKANREPGVPRVEYSMAAYNPHDDRDVLADMNFQAGGIDSGAQLFIDTFSREGSAIAQAPDLENAKYCLGVALDGHTIDRLPNASLRGRKRTINSNVSDMYGYGAGIAHQLVQFVHNKPADGSAIGFSLQANFHDLTELNTEQNSDLFVRDQVANGIVRGLIEASRSQEADKSSIARKLHFYVQPQDWLVKRIYQSDIAQIQPLATKLEDLLTTNKLRIGSSESFSRISHQLLVRAVELQTTQPEFTEASTVHHVLAGVTTDNKKCPVDFEKLFKFMNIFQNHPRSGLQSYNLSDLNEITKTTYEAQAQVSDRIMYIATASNKKVVPSSPEITTVRRLGHCARMFAEQASGVLNTQLRPIMTKVDLTVRYPDLEPSDHRELFNLFLQGITARTLHIHARTLLQAELAESDAS